MRLAHSHRNLEIAQIHAVGIEAHTSLGRRSMNDNHAGAIRPVCMAPLHGGKSLATNVRNLTVDNKPGSLAQLQPAAFGAHVSCHKRIARPIIVISRADNRRFGQRPQPVADNLRLFRQRSVLAAALDAGIYNSPKTIGMRCAALLRDMQQAQAEVGLIIEFWRSPGRKLPPTSCVAVTSDDALSLEKGLHGDMEDFLLWFQFFGKDKKDDLAAKSYEMACLLKSMSVRLPTKWF